MLPAISKEEFCKRIESRVKNKRVSYLEAVIDLQEDCGLDASFVVKLLSQPLLEKLEMEGKQLNLLKKKKNTLPFS